MTRETVTHRDGHVYEFGPEMEAVYEAADGESVTIATRDSLNGAIQRDDDLLEEIPEEVNAATGPIAVTGASPGDVLAVEIEAVRVAEDRGRVVTTPGFGLLRDDPEIDHPATRITEVDGDGPDDGAGERIDFEGIDVPIEPVLGTIGVCLLYTS
ncbi:acetamidase/Formamidase, partial [Halorubrum coriense DSM 10284]